MKKVLVTGISGFAGSYLAELLLSKRKYKVYGTYLTPNLKNIDSVRNKLELIRVDLTSMEKIHEAVKSINPDLIFHLAALTFPADSFKNPLLTIKNNVIAQINLLEAVKNNRVLDSRILIISSAEVYGEVKKEDLPIDEEIKLMPNNPYAVSKVTQDFLGLQYFLSYKLKVVRIRPFNHIGPRQSPSLVVGAFAKKIAEIEKGKKEPVMLVGNLEAKRDFTDVRDMVEAYLLAIENGKEGDVYNIGSGESHRISEVLDKLLSLSKVKISIKSDPKLFRPVDTPELRCDAGKFRKLTGWQPKISLETTLSDTLDYWRKIV